MKKLIIILLIVCSSSLSWAQSPRGERLTPEEFRAKQEAFITQKANLTKEEAAKFFPVYFEMQNEKKALNDNSWNLIKKGKDPATTEAQYENIIETTLDNRIRVDEIEKEYYKQFRKILSAKQLYKVQHAEMRFHRELLKGVNKKKK
ncbi:MAG: hypothetical protein RSA44_03115 [Bacteroides sp.]